MRKRENSVDLLIKDLRKLVKGKEDSSDALDTAEGKVDTLLHRVKSRHNQRKKSASSSEATLP